MKQKCGTNGKEPHYLDYNEKQITEIQKDIFRKITLDRPHLTSMTQGWKVKRREKTKMKTEQNKKGTK